VTRRRRARRACFARRTSEEAAGATKFTQWITTRGILHVFRIILGDNEVGCGLSDKVSLQTFQQGVQAARSVLKVPMPGQSFNASLSFDLIWRRGTVLGSERTDQRRRLWMQTTRYTRPAHPLCKISLGNTNPATSVNGFQTSAKSCAGAAPADDGVVFSIKTGASATLNSMTVTPSFDDQRESDAAV